MTRCKNKIYLKRIILSPCRKCAGLLAKAKKFATVNCKPELRCGKAVIKFDENMQKKSCLFPSISNTP